MTSSVMVEVSSWCNDDVIDDINDGGKIQILGKKILAFLDNTQD